MLLLLFCHFNSFLAQCAEMPPEELAANPPRTRAKLFHKYLAAVEAEVHVNGVCNVEQFQLLGVGRCYGLHRL